MVEETNSHDKTYNVKIAVVVPMLANVNPRVFATGITAMYRWGRVSGTGCKLYTPLRLPIASARNLCIRDIMMDLDIKYVFFWDEDTELYPHTIRRLVDRMEQYPDLIGVQPRYYIRGYPFELMAFKHRADLGEDTSSKDTPTLRSPTPEEEITWTDENGMLWCFAVGNSCSLVRADIFRKIEPPWFQTTMFYTEDVFFYSKVHSFIHNAKVAMDMTFTCGHQLGVGAVNGNNAEMLRKRYEDLAHEVGGPIEALIYDKDPSLGRV